MTADPMQVVQNLELHIHRLDEGGGFRVGAGLLGPGFHVRDPHQLWSAVRQILQVAAGGPPIEVKDVVAPQSAPVREPVLGPSYSKRAVMRPDQADPSDWSPTADGRWRSPAGRLYRPETAVARSVMDKRAKLGLPLRYEDIAVPQPRALEPPPTWCGKVRRRRR